MSLNISGAQSGPGEPGEPGEPGGSPLDESPARQQLIEELTAELSSWNPREFFVAFRRLHRDSLSLIHLNVLTVLELDGALSMGGLAEALDVSVASATGIVTRMEARDLVERTHDEHDRRVVLVQRTEAGKDVFRGIDEHRRQGLLRLLAQLTDAELAGFLSGHRALRTARAIFVNDPAHALGGDAAPTTDQEPQTR